MADVMSRITTHVLDTARGVPAAGVPVVLEHQLRDHSWHKLADSATNGDGRISNLVPPGQSIDAGMYRLTFETQAYFDANEMRGFYPRITVVFCVSDASEHYHVPLLLSPFGYSTYRGS